MYHSHSEASYLDSSGMRDSFVVGAHPSIEDNYRLSARAAERAAQLQAVKERKASLQAPPKRRRQLAWRRSRVAKTA
jgi:hypothetical protein